MALPNFQHGSCPHSSRRQRRGPKTIYSLETMGFDAKPYLKEIARGPGGRRDLTREQALTLFAADLCRRSGGPAPGRRAGGLPHEGRDRRGVRGNDGGARAARAPLRLPSRRAIPLVLPTYNGSRKLPNLVPLLALLLAREGVPVLLHGAAQEAQRVGTFEILAELGHAPGGIARRGRGTPRGSACSRRCPWRCSPRPWRGCSTRASKPACATPRTRSPRCCCRAASHRPRRRASSQ